MNSQDPGDFFRALMDDWMPGTKSGDASGRLKGVVDQALSAANIATRAEVEALHARIAILEDRVARLDRRLGKAKSKNKNKKARPPSAE